MTASVRSARTRPLPAVETTATFCTPVDGLRRRLLLGGSAPCVITTPRGSTGYLLSAHLNAGQVVGYRLTICDPDRDDNGQCYDIPAELDACECKDFLVRHHRRADFSCKHISGTRELLNQIGL